MTRGRRAACQPLHTVAVRLTSLYHGPASPLDGIGRAVYAGLQLLAQHSLESRARQAQHRTSPATSHVTCRTEHLDLTDSPAVTLTDPFGEPLSVAAMATYLDLPRHQVVRSLDVLERLGELERDPAGAWVLRRFGEAQSTPEARRKAKQRARKRDANAQNSETSHGTTHGTSPAVQCDTSQDKSRDMSRPARASDLRSQTEFQISTETITTLDAPEDRARAHAAERSPEDVAQRGHAWLNALLVSVGSFAAGHPTGGRWQRAYTTLGERPDHELEAVAVFIRPHLRTGTLKPRRMSPQHLVDFWLSYLDGHLPFELDAPASREPVIVASDDEYASDVARNPAWLSDHEAHP